MAEDNDNLNQQQTNTPTNPAAEAAKEAASKATKDFAKKSIKSATSNAVRTFLLPILPWILGIAIALIIIAGLIMFFVSGMGLIFGALNDLAESFKEYCAGKWYGTHNVVDPIEIIQVADKLESMGYDLYGEGFVTGKADGKVADGLKTYRAKIGQDVDENSIPDSVYHDNYGVTNINSTIIKRYLVSDNYIYTLYNNNPAWRSLFTGDTAPHENFILKRSGLIRLISENNHNEFGSYGRVFGEWTGAKLLKGIVELRCTVNFLEIMR